MAPPHSRQVSASGGEKGADATVTDVAEFLSRHDDESARRVGVMLYPYTRAGTYARYFEGRANIDLDNPFVVLELGELDTKPDLQTVVLLMLMMRITEAMYQGDRKQRKLCIVDEAWRLMGHGDAGGFIEQGYRTARKFGGAFMTITQGIDDYYRSGTSKAALENADWVFLLRQKLESLKAAENSDRLVLDEGEALFARGPIAHNHFDFHADAMQLFLDLGDRRRVEHDADALAEFTPSEPLPWTDFHVARGRALAAFGRGDRSTESRDAIGQLRDEAKRIGANTALSALEEAWQSW